MRKRRRFLVFVVLVLTFVRDFYRFFFTLGGVVGFRFGFNLGLVVMLFRGVVSFGFLDFRGRLGFDVVFSGVWVECFFISSCEYRKAVCLWRTNEVVL